MPETLTPKQVLLTDEIANEKYVGFYAERRLSRMVITAGSVLLLGSFGVIVSLSHRPIQNRYIRIDEMGKATAIQYSDLAYTSDELIASGSLPEQVRDTVVRLVGERKNGIISGGTGSGKTTLMKSLLDHIPHHERLIVIEQPAELKVAHPNAVRWEAVEAIPGQVAITPSQLLAAALRHRPDRIIMGEIRDECGYDLLQAMNTGHGGTLSTIHAKSAWDALNRLSDLALSARPNLNHAFVRSETAEAIDFVLYCERDDAGRRRVRELISVTGYAHADQSFQTEEIYRAPLLQRDPERTTAMDLLALNSAQHRFTKSWSLEVDSSPARPLAIGRDSRFPSEDWGGSGKVRLPDVGLSKEQRDWGVQSCVFNYESRSCSVTASGPIRRPAARRSSASALRPYGLRFPPSPDPP